MITKDDCNRQAAVQRGAVPEDNLSVSSMQGWKKQRLDPASAPIASATSNHEGVVAVKGAMGLAGVGGEGTSRGSQQMMSGVRAVEVVAEYVRGITCWLE